MRTARFVRVLLPLVFAAVPTLRPPPSCATEPQIVDDPRSAPASPAARPVAGVIHLRGGDSIAVSFVGPWGLNAIRYVAPDGEPGYLSTHRIERITASTGADLTRRVVQDRQSLGESREAPPPSVAAWLTAPFRGPSSRGRAYTITELSVMVDPGRSDVGGDGGLSSAGLGGMAALSRSWSLGGVVHLMSNMDDLRALDVGVRLRRYLTDRASIDLTAGVFTAAGDWDTRGAPPFGEAAVTVADAVSLVARVDRATWERAVFTPWQQGYEDSRTRTTWRVGVRLGPSPRWVSIPTFVAGLLAFLTPPEREVY